MPTMPTVNEQEIARKCAGQEMYLNAYIVTRIVLEIVRTYITNNSPSQCGVQLAQVYNPDPTKSDILLDIAYNWREKDISKVPAIFIQRSDDELKSPTMGQTISENTKLGSEDRLVIHTMPVIISCVAAEPLAVVENLAEWVKQPLLYFRKEIQLDFGLRGFKVVRITAPKLLKEGKNNFSIDILLNITFDDGWKISRDSLVLKKIGVELFDKVIEPIQSFNI